MTTYTKTVAQLLADIKNANDARDGLNAILEALNRDENLKSELTKALPDGFNKDVTTYIASATTACFEYERLLRGITETTEIQWPPTGSANP